MQVDLFLEGAQIDRRHHHPHRKLKLPSSLDQHETESGSVKLGPQFGIPIPDGSGNAVQIRIRA